MAPLLDVLETLGGAALLFDTNDRLIARTEECRSLLRELEAVLVPGCAYPDFCRALAAGSLVRPSTGTVEGWLARRLALPRTVSPPFLLQASDGRELEASERFTSDGRRVCRLAPGVDVPARYAVAWAPLFELLPEPACCGDLAGPITRVNAAMASALGTRPAELAGRVLDGLVPDGDRPAVSDAFDRLRRGQSVCGLLTRVLHRGGSQHWFSWTLVPLVESGAFLALARDVTSQWAQRRHERAVQRDLVDALERVIEGFALFDADDRLIHFNRKFSDLYPSGSVTAGMRFADLTRALARSGLMEAARGREEAWVKERLARHHDPRGIVHFQLHDGRWLQVDEQPTSAGGTVLLRSDITEVKRQEQTYALFATAVEQAGDAIELRDAHSRLLYVNPAFTRLTGFEPEEALGHDPIVLMRHDEPDPSVHVEMRQRLARGEVWTGRLVSRRKDGRPVHQDATISPVRDEQGRITHYVAVKRDVTERIEAEARIQYLAHHDALTELPNRALFQDRLHQALTRSRRSGDAGALLFLDLDHFKDVNDTLGHATGDALLRTAAERLVECVRETDTVCRLGGDEFAILQVDSPSTEAAIALAERVGDALSRPFSIEGQEIHTSASVGITLYPQDGAEAEQLLKCADLALYRAKAEGRDRYRFFRQDLRQEVEARAVLERDLRRALGADQFSLVFQPLVDLGTMSIQGLEALVRWRHPERGLVLPAQFIPIAEETGLIVPLTDWILRTACREARTWQEQGLPPLRIAVNLSPVQFRHRGLVDMVVEALRETRLEPQFLELEITERVLVEDAERALDLLTQLKALGVHISMDDFGTGYASLGYLRRFPFTKIKIDQSFVRDVCTDPESAAIVRSVIGLGKSLKLRVTAEGVESEDQLASLRGEGCEEVQGFLFAMPLPPDQIVRLLRAGLIPGGRSAPLAEEGA